MLQKLQISVLGNLATPVVTMVTVRVESRAAAKEKLISNDLNGHLNNFLDRNIKHLIDSGSLM